MDLHDKVRGCFLGIAIGDALGKPVETCKAAYIAEKHGRVQDYLDSSGHKWFDGHQKGTTTDDWQLTKAVARSFINSGGKFDLDAVALEHSKEFAQSVLGWGGSTREAVARITEGTHWKEAGITDKPNRGTGNGVCMKIAPVGLYLRLTNPACDNPQWDEDLNKMVHFALMTHRTTMGVASGLAHAYATFRVFESTPDNFDPAAFVRCVYQASLIAENAFNWPHGPKDDLAVRMQMLSQVSGWTTQDIIDNFGGGSCYVYDSLPFTYAFFLKNPHSIDSLYDCVSAGGDTDSNGSMLAGLLGALHGTSIFPEHLIDGLQEKEEVLAVADEFYATFDGAKS